MARTKPKTTGDTSGSKTTSKGTTCRGYPSTNKVDNNFDLDVSSDAKACKTGLFSESAKAGYTSLSSSAKNSKTDLSMGNIKVGVTNLNSNNLASSTQTSPFQDALSAFNHIKSTPNTGFFKSYVNHDPEYQPKYKRFKCRPDPTQQEHLHKARLFHDWLNQPSSYPSEYKNFLHGSLNYWFVPNTGHTFKPDLSLKPFVPHPHMHPLYAQTFLKTPHIHESKSYMLPSYGNHKETIFFRDTRQWLQQT